MLTTVINQNPFNYSKWFKQIVTRVGMINTQGVTKVEMIECLYSLCLSVPRPELLNVELVTADPEMSIFNMRNGCSYVKLSKHVTFSLLNIKASD